MAQSRVQVSSAGWLARAAGLAVVAAMCAGTAQAQSYVRADCRPLVAASRLDETSLTGRWYRRFWTGECGGLGGCLAGSPNWNEIVGQLVARSDAKDREAVLARACRLGPVIGLEWTRPRDVRRIDSGDLRAFKSTLQSSGAVTEGLAKVEAQAQAKLGAPRK